MITLAVMSEEKRRDKIDETKKEFPELFILLKNSLLRLYERGTIKNKRALNIPHVLKEKLEFEMSKHI